MIIVIFRIRQIIITNNSQSISNCRAKIPMLKKDQLIITEVKRKEAPKHINLGASLRIVEIPNQGPEKIQKSQKSESRRLPKSMKR